MKNIVADIFLLFTGLTAAACTEQDMLNSNDPVSLTAAIYEDNPTRTSMSGSKASFIATDKIGVFETLTGSANIPYTYNGTTWSTPSAIYWRNGTSTHTFYAYYPHNATNQGAKIAIPVLSGQTITTSPAATADLLVAAAQNQTRSPGVALTFTHAYALIQFNIKMGILQLINPYYLNRITIRGGNPSGNSNRYGIVNISGNPGVVAYDLAAGSFWAASNDTNSYAQSFYSDITGISLSTTAITLYAFVLPGTYTNPVPAVSFRITVLGITNNTAYSNFSNTTFQPGTKYVYDVSIGLLSRAASPQLTITAQKPVPYGTEP